jgi:serine/threonine-protein kinase
MPYCFNCGNPVYETDRFCASCGAELIRRDATQDRVRRFPTSQLNHPEQTRLFQQTETINKEVGFKTFITWPVKKIMALVGAGAIALFLVIGSVAGLFKAEDREVPNLIGMSLQDAKDRLEKSGLKCEKGKEEYSADVSLGHVVRTDPAAGRKVQQGTKITLVISLGPETTHTVPDLKGKSLEAAIAILEENGLKNYKTVEEYLAVPSGYVVRHVPGSGQQVRSQNIITLYISTAISPQMVSVPNVTGKSRSEAEKIIRNADLVVGGVTEKNDPNVPKGNVISQDPTAGRKMNSGSKITLVISLGSEDMPIVRVNVPPLKHLSYNRAIERLKNEDLKYVRGEDEYSAVVSSGLVTRTDPAAGVEVDSGSTVIVFISKGPEPPKEGY